MKAIVKLIENQPFLIVEDGLENKAVLCKESLAWIKKYSPLSEGKGIVFEVEMVGIGNGITYYSIYQIMNLYYLKYPTQNGIDVYVCSDPTNIDGMSITQKESEALRFNFKVARALKEVLHPNIEVVKILYK